MHSMAHKSQRVVALKLVSLKCDLVGCVASIVALAYCRFYVAYVY